MARHLNIPKFIQPMAIFKIKYRVEKTGLKFNWKKLSFIVNG